MKTTLLIAGFALAFSISIFGQNSYNFSTYTQTYEPVEGGNTIEIGEEFGDATVIDLGFDFQFADETLTQITVFGLETGLFLENESISAITFLNGFIDNAELDGTPSSASYATTGAAGNRICKIDYKRLGFYGVFDDLEAATGDNLIDFQIWFYENGSIVEFHFGESTISDPELAYDGASGPSILVLIGQIFDEEELNADFFLVLSGNPANPTLTTSIDDLDEFVGLDSTPASGRVYRFAPDLPTSLSEADQVEISIYPTLAVDAITVKSSFTGKKKYQIFDITGKEVMNGLMSDQERIQVSQLHAGVYLFALEGSAKAQKFVKQ